MDYSTPSKGQQLDLGDETRVVLACSYREHDGHLLTTGVGAPFVVDQGNFAGCVRVFNYVDFRLMIGHGTRPRD
jgi:hypothetical protein